MHFYISVLIQDGVFYDIGEILGLRYFRMFQEKHLAKRRLIASDIDKFREIGHFCQQAAAKQVIWNRSLINRRKTNAKE